MIEIAKRTSIGALLLMIIPFGLWASGWQWQPNMNYYWLIWFYWFTQSITYQYGIIIFTSILLLCWFLWCLRYHRKPTLYFIAILITTFIISESINVVIKESVQVTRPFVLWLNNSCNLNEHTWYRMSEKARCLLVAQHHHSIPIWLQKHWCSTKGFSFPSGHTIYVVNWALLAIGILWPRRHFISSIVIFIWASGVIISRMLLGMHWSYDLFMGCWISWLVITIACWLISRWIESPNPK